MKHNWSFMLRSCGLTATEFSLKLKCTKLISLQVFQTVLTRQVEGTWICFFLRFCRGCAACPWFPVFWFSSMSLSLLRTSLRACCVLRLSLWARLTASDFLLSLLYFFVKSAPEEGRVRQIFLPYLVTEPLNKTFAVMSRPFEWNRAHQK